MGDGIPTARGDPPPRVARVWKAPRELLRALLRVPPAPLLALGLGVTLRPRVGFGLTDPVLAHVPSPEPTTQAGHRWSLLPLAQDLVAIRLDALATEQLAAAGLPPAEAGRGPYGAAVARGTAPLWIARNAAALDAIEERTHPRRGLASRLRDAFRPWPSIHVTLTDTLAARP